MTTDNKTLADVQPGGRVRLGDALLHCPFCGDTAERIDFGIGSGDNEGGSCVACTGCGSSGPVEFGFKENFLSNWNRRALSAQPSPGGQGEALDLDRVLSLADVHAEESREDGVRLLNRGGLLAFAQDVAAALAARQPVGEPEPYVVGNQYFTQTGDLVRFVAVHNEGTSYECMEDEAGVNRYTRRDFGRVTGSAHDYSDPRNTPPLYATPPAQAVDLGRWSQRHAEDLKQAIHTALSAHAGSLSQKKRDAISDYVKRLLIDSQAVGNG